MTIRYFTRNTLVALCAAFALPSPSEAQSLTVHGVNAEMSYQEVVAALRDRSRHCNDPIEQELGKENRILVYCWSKNITTEEKSDILVEATDRRKLVSIDFGCTATRTCGLRVNEIVTALIEAKIIPLSDSNHYSDDMFTYKDENENHLRVWNIIGSPMIQIGVNEEKYREFDF